LLFSAAITKHSSSWWRGHQLGVFNFFFRLIGQREAAEDHTQEVFLRL